MEVHANRQNMPERGAKTNKIMMWFGSEPLSYFLSSLLTSQEQLMLAIRSHALLKVKN